MQNFYRQKLIQTVTFFAKRTKKANTTKMCKLLCFFDFEHFCQTGFPAIGLTYYTFPRGPVPKEFWLQIKGGNIPEDFNNYIGIDIVTYEKELDDITEYIFKAKKKPDVSVFTPRELKILEELVLIYRDATAKMMSKISHEKEKPWTITKEKYGLDHLIDYKLSLTKESCITEQQAVDNLKEHHEMLHNFELNPV